MQGRRLSCTSWGGNAQWLGRGWGVFSLGNGLVVLYLPTNYNVNEVHEMKSSKHYPWVVVGLLWVVALLNYMDRQMLSTMKAAMSVDIVELQSGEVFGALMAAFMWVYGLASPFAGFIADRMNRKWLIVGSLFVWSLVTLLMGLTTNYSMLYGLRMVMGFSEAMYIPAALALIADYHTGKSRSLAIGVHMTGLYVGSALGGLGALLSEELSWQSTFFYFGLFGTVYALVLAFLLHETDAHTQRLKAEPAPTASSNASGGNMPENTFKTILSSVPFWGILIVFLSISLPGWATKNWLPTLFAQNLNLDMRLAGPMATVTMALSSFVGVFIGGTISDRWARSNVRARVFTSMIGLSMMAPALLLLGFGHSYLTVVGGCLLFGVGIGFFDTNNMPIVCQFFSARYRSTAYGVINMAGVIAGGYITQALGKSEDANNLGRDFALMAGVVVVVVLVQLLLLKPRTDDMKD